MKPELEQKLFNDFPLLYQDKDKSPQESLLCFGCECGDGWFQLIYNLSAKLEVLIQKYKDENPGEYYPRAVQIKEKFGGLRLYLTASTKEMDDEITKAEDEALITCEICGSKAKLMHKGTWYQTLCDKCGKENGYQHCKGES